MIVVDVETTGLNAYKNSIVSIGAVEFENPKNQFYDECYVEDDIEIDPGALQVNGFSLEQVKDRTKKSLLVLVQEFLDWVEPIKDKTLAGHNTYFDASFLRAATTKLKKNPDDHKWPFGRRYIDMHSVAYAIAKQTGAKMPLKYGVSNFWSGGVYEFVGLPLEPDPHNGLTGAKMEAEAMSRLIYGKGIYEEYAGFKLPKFLNRSGSD